MGNSLENLSVYNTALKISDLAWNIFETIPRHNYSTAIQFLDAVDSIGANIAEGYGRGTFRDRKHFLAIARGSLYETSFWLERLLKRNLIHENLATELKELLRSESFLINGYTRYIKSKIP